MRLSWIWQICRFSGFGPYLTALHGVDSSYQCPIFSDITLLYLGYYKKLLGTIRFQSVRGHLKCRWKRAENYDETEGLGCIFFMKFFVLKTYLIDHWCAKYDDSMCNSGHTGPVGAVWGPLRVIKLPKAITWQGVNYICPNFTCQILWWVPISSPRSETSNFNFISEHSAAGCSCFRRQGN